jgi:TonB family protein
MPMLLTPRALCAVALIATATLACGGDRGTPRSPTASPSGPRMVPQVELERYRIGGKGDAMPDDREAKAMAKRNRGTLGILKLCVNDKGAPSKIEVLRSTGFGAYDLKLATLMATWRFRPFLIEGRPVAVCTSVTFIFRPCTATLRC